MLLRTLPQIDADTAAGIIDPTKPVPINVPVLDQHADSDEDEHDDDDRDLDSDADSDSDEDADSETEADPETETEAHLDSTTIWDPSIPEPDPKKKPS